MCLSKKSPITNRVAIPGRPVSLYSGAISPSIEVPVYLARELHQLVLHVDDLIQPRAEQITRSCRLVLLRPHRFSSMRRSNHASRFEGISRTKLQGFRASAESLQS